jgi:hypothetical protein
MAARALQVTDSNDPNRTVIIQLTDVVGVKHNAADNTVWLMTGGVEVLVPMSLADVLKLLDWRVIGTHDGGWGR